MNLPNRLSILRIIMIPVFVVFFYLPYAFAPYVALAVFVLAALTDFLDGYIARKHNLVTDLGKLLDPIADKMLVCTALFVVVSTNVLGTDWSVAFLAVSSAVILARELLISAVRQIAAAKGTVIHANSFGKLKTISQDIALPFLIVLQARTLDTVLPDTFYTVIWWCGLIVFSLATVLTIISGVIYMVQNRGVFAEQ